MEGGHGEVDRGRPRIRCNSVVTRPTRTHCWQQTGGIISPRLHSQRVKGWKRLAHTAAIRPR